MRTTAGLACYRTKRVILNPKLIEVSAGEVQRTLRHELAHLVAQARAGRRRIAAHGAEWFEACADLGIPDEKRCHELPFKPRRIARKFFYQCPACDTVLSRVHRVKTRVACIKCCRKHNGGKYLERYRFREVAGPSERIAA
jgi:predicted SprT family Zn-dependent metalloprotease